jgi:hypothetical protein
MFSNKENKVREKHFPSRNHKTKGQSTHHKETLTMTDNHLLFLAQRARKESSLHQPVGFWKRIFGWR